MPKPKRREPENPLPRSGPLPEIAFLVPPIARQFEGIEEVLSWAAGEVLRIDRENQKLREEYEELRTRYEACQNPGPGFRVIPHKGSGAGTDGAVLEGQMSLFGNGAVERLVPIDPSR